MRSALLNVMVQAATKAGRSLAKDFGEVQKARPTYSFLGEEGTEVKGSDGQHRWIVDPLDGTTNFLHGIPLFACAIALERNNEIVASVIYNPAMEELYTAEKGGGAWLNDRKRLRVANRKHLADAVVVTGINSRGRALDVLQLKQLAQVVPAVSGIRRTGSASTDLAWLAAGRFDGYWEAGLAPWDVAPGFLMVREAGGVVSDYAGTAGAIWNGQVIAGNETIQGQLLKIVKAVN